MNVEEEKIKVAQMMERYGGSFASNLARTLYSADHINTRKIKETWPELWHQYLEMWREE